MNPERETEGVSEEDLQPKFLGFHDLMPHKVKEILLVATLYDSFLLEEDGRLSERIFSDYVSLHLSYPPRVTRVSSGEKALQALKNRPFDLVVSMLRLPDMDPVEFIAKVKESHPQIPAAILSWDRERLRRKEPALARAGVDALFLWTGDTSIFLAMVKLLEDRMNLEHDILKGDIRLLVVTEDSVRYASVFLPLLYQEIMSQTRSLMDQGLNDLEKLYRMRARPKLVLARTFEEALDPVIRFPNNVLGYISDIRFPRGGKVDGEAGFALVRAVRRRVPDIPFLLLSSEPANREKALREGAVFLDKNDPTLLHQVRAFMKSHLGFGAFLFRKPDGTVTAVAHDMTELAEKIRTVPDEVLLYHARGNHFSHWLAARGEFALASAIRPWRVEDFKDITALRNYLVGRIENTRMELERGMIADLPGRKYRVENLFTRIGPGSLGGKSRGVAFLGALLEKARLEEEFPGIQVRVPRTIALGAGLFEAFVEENDLTRVVTSDLEDEEVARAFLEGEFPPDIPEKLAKVLEVVRTPLAVRSSSLLEDSPDQPFAGVFATYMLPNNHPDKKVRLAQLLRAVKLVYASTWSRAARRYLEATGHNPAEEKMGVAIQQLVGRTYGTYYYPLVSGVAQTHNFYPKGYIKPEDGTAVLALGLGKTVVEGQNALRICPRYPRLTPQTDDLKKVLDATQRTFWALDLSDPGAEVQPGSDAPLVELGLDQAEKDGTLLHVASVLSWEEDRLKDGLNAKGARVVTFAPILKWETFPLAPLLVRILEKVRKAMGGPAEVEFAANLSDRSQNLPAEIHLLQVRPLTTAEALEPLEVVSPSEERILVRTSRGLGHGKLEDIRDVLYVRPSSFDKLFTREVVAEVEERNSFLVKEGRPYLLIGPGRWGTADPFLGIPVRWDQVSGVKVLVEADLEGFEVEPSQGSHFFHNVTAFGVFLLTVSIRKPGELVDWEWLESIPPFREGRYLRHLRLEDSLSVYLDGHTGSGLVLKPGPLPLE